MDVKKLRTFVHKIGTPSYFYDEDIFKQRVCDVQEAFGRNVKLCFSIKANPFLLSNLPEEFSNIEVCSPGELTICEKLQIDMNKVVFSGVNKTQQDIERAMDDQVGVFTAESFRHLQLIEIEAKRRNIIVPVLLRIAKGSQFGMDVDTVRDIIKNRCKYSHIELVGIHYFTGTQKRKSEIILKELDFIQEFICIIKEELNFDIKKVEYGTGLAVEYFEKEADKLEMSHLGEISAAIQNLAEEIELTVEMGRFFAASCGFYCTEVVDVKTNNGINYAICDGGINQLKYDGQIQGMQTPFITHIKNGTNRDTSSKSWAICGSLCTTADVLARNVEFFDLEVGDLLVFHRTGAYSLMEGITTFLSRETAIVVLCSVEKGVRVIRERMFTDMFNVPNVERRIEL